MGGINNNMGRFMDGLEESKQVENFKKNAVIFREGDRASRIYLLMGGKVKIHKHWGASKELILHFYSQGDIFGYRGLGKHQYYTVTATALEDCTACSITLDVFKKSLNNDHLLTLKFLEFHLNELRETEERMRDLVHMDVRGRVANTILMLMNKFETSSDGIIRIKIKRQDLAAYAGTTYETFFRVMSQFEKEKRIKVKDKEIQVLDQKHLLLYGQEPGKT